MSRTKSRWEKRFHSNTFEGLGRKAFQIERLETRTLLSTSSVTIGTGISASFLSMGSPLQATEFDGSAITANAGATVTIDVKITTPGGPGSSYPTPTGFVSLTFGAPGDDGTGVEYIPLGGSNGTATASAQFTLPSKSLNIDDPNLDYLEAEYLGDSFYADSGLIDSQQIVVTFDSTDQLAFIQQPSNSAVDDKIAPPVKVQEQLPSGSPIGDGTASITLSLASGNGTLAGTLTEPAVNGIATFSDLSIDTSGPYTLSAAASNFTPVSSNLFTISPGKLVFIKQPHNGTAGESLNPAIVVAFEDSKNKIITDDSSSIITLAPVGATGGNPITGNSMQLINGVATFSSLQLSEPGTYSLQATDGGDAEVSSAKFQIGGDHLVFTKQPASTDVNAPITFSVALEDSKNKINTDDNSDQVQISLQTVQGGSNAALTGATTLAFVNGVATFTVAQALEINSEGTFTLTATELDSTDVPVAATSIATSKPLKVGGYHLVFTKKPSTTSVNAPVLFTVAIEDAKNKIDTTDDTTTLSIVPLLSPATSGVNAQFTVTPANPVMVNGIATFNSSQLLSIQDPGSYTITVTALDTSLPLDTLTPLDTVEPATSNGFKVMGYHLSFVEQPPTTNVNAPVLFSVVIRDFHNGVVETDESTPLEILPLTFPSKSGVNAEFTLTPTNPIAHDGVFIFDASTLLSFQDVGTYTITAIALDSSVPLSTLTPSASIASVTSKPFKII
jgi:hypothetical protein